MDAVVALAVVELVAARIAAGQPVSPELAGVWLVDAAEYVTVEQAADVDFGNVELAADAVGFDFEQKTTQPQMA